MRARLSLEEARAAALRAQGFGLDGPFGPSTAPIAVLDHLGAIQLDSVSVIARPQQVVPFARLGPTSRDAMHRAIYHERRGFEYWGHEASWLPMAEYRYFLPRMARLRATTSERWLQIRQQHADLYPLILERIRAEGPLSSAHFEDPRASRGVWWDRKPAKLVLEDLFDCGDLMCTERTAGFARLYDLPERVLPTWVDTRNPGADEAARYLLLRGFGALGVATPRDAADYFRLKTDSRRPALEALLEAGDVIPVTVDGWKDQAYAPPAALDGDLSIPDHSPTLLSPFDNLVWARDRVERLFRFHYRIEIYVPEAKRQYGYYVLPLLVRGALVGRADLKLDRAAEYGATLRVRGLWLEVAPPAPSPIEVAEALTRLATHLHAPHIALDPHVRYPGLRTALRAQKRATT